MRNHGLDLLKFFAIVAVVLAHTGYFSLVPSILFIGFQMPFFIVIAGIFAESTKSLYNRIAPFIITTLPVLYIIWTRNEVPGSYFVPLFLQCLLLAPIAIWMYRRNPTTTLLIAATINIVFELLYWTIPYQTYRICILRYLFIFVLGFVISDILRGGTNKSRWIYVFGVISTLIFFTGIYQLLPFEPHWIENNLFLTGFAASVTLLAGMSNLDSNPLSSIGETTLAIFVVQTVWFTYFYSSFDATPLLRVIISLVACGIVGFVYHHAIKMFINTKSPTTQHVL